MISIRLYTICSNIYTMLYNQAICAKFPLLCDIAELSLLVLGVQR